LPVNFFSGAGSQGDQLVLGETKAEIREMLMSLSEAHLKEMEKRGLLPKGRG